MNSWNKYYISNLKSLKWYWWWFARSMLGAWLTTYIHSKHIIHMRDYLFAKYVNCCVSACVLCATFYYTLYDQRSIFVKSESSQSLLNAYQQFVINRTNQWLKPIKYFRCRLFFCIICASFRVSLLLFDHIFTDRCGARHLLNFHLRFEANPYRFLVLSINRWNVVVHLVFNE